MRYQTLLICLVVLSFSACSRDSDPPPGSEGGPCKIGKEPCSGELACIDGQCSADDAPDTPTSLKIEFNVAERRLTADGKDKTPLFISATTGSKDKAFKGRLVVYPSPSTAGSVRFIPDEGDLPKPGKFVELKFNDEGTATAEYITCDRGTIGLNDCPEFVFLNVARPASDQKFEPIARSPVMKLLSSSTADDPTLDESKCNEAGVHIVVRKTADAEDDKILTAKPTIDLKTGELSLVGAGLNLTLRAGIGQTQSDTTNISRLDVALEVGESLMLPSPCDDGGALLWSGFFSTQAVEVVSGQLKTLKANFELACSASESQTATITGCMLIENEIMEDPEPTMAEPDMMNDGGGMPAQ